MFAKACQPRAETLGGTALGITSAVPDWEEGLLLIVTSYRNISLSIDLLRFKALEGFAGFSNRDRVPSISFHAPIK